MLTRSGMGDAPYHNSGVLGHGYRDLSDFGPQLLQDLNGRPYTVRGLLAYAHGFWVEALAGQTNFEATDVARQRPLVVGNGHIPCQGVSGVMSGDGAYGHGAVGHGARDGPDGIHRP